MNLTRPALVAWQPKTKEDREAVRAELELVLASHQFCNSKRYPALLRYVVEKTLDGLVDDLKERTLGIDVFHRPADYDTNTDTVVRYTAGEVRKRLAVYFHEHEPGSGIQISLPAGSYVPEFFREAADSEQDLSVPTLDARSVDSYQLLPEAASTLSAVPASQPLTLRREPLPDSIPRLPVAASNGRWYVLAIALLLVIGGMTWKYTGDRPTAVDQFWAQTLHEPGKTLMCTGGVVFENNNFSGTHTAGKEIEYPFVSMQIVSSISQISGLLERGGATYEVRAASSLPLTDMRERPIILFGGYNNQWTMRLLRPLRFHFSPEPQPGIVDMEHPNVRWARDQSQSYASTDDYALFARFRDTTTGSLVVVVAGLGRNGTEVASQFVTSPHYMRLLREKAGRGLATSNIEVILKTSVIGGRTGAPTIEALHLW